MRFGDEGGEDAPVMLDLFGDTCCDSTRDKLVDSARLLLSTADAGDDGLGGDNGRAASNASAGSDCLDTECGEGVRLRFEYED